MSEVTPALSKRPRIEETPATASASYDHIKIQVGNDVYATTVSTLENGGHGYFASLFGVGSAFGDAERMVFVDRDGALFKHVLHWMRTHSLAAALAHDAHLLIDVAVEADFFGLDDLKAACTERATELKEALEKEIAKQAPPEPAVAARSFSVKVIGSTADDTPNDAGNWKSVGGSGNIQCAHGEVVYLQSAVLGGQVSLKRTRPKDDDGADGMWSRSGCYLTSGLQTFYGDFKLEYRRADTANTPPNRHLLSHRGLDDGERSNKMFDVNFREYLDVAVDGPIFLRAIGLGEWTVHGWVGPLESIPRVGVAGVGKITPTAGAPSVSGVADRVALTNLKKAESSCLVM